MVGAPAEVFTSVRCLRDASPHGFYGAEELIPDWVAERMSSAPQACGAVSQHPLAAHVPLWPMHVQRIVDGVHLLARLYPDVWGKHVWDEASVLASDAVAQLLDKLRQMQSSDTEQVRASLRIASNGETRVVLGNMAPASSEIYPVRLDTQPTLVDTPYVYVKTDQRSLYDEARARVHGNLGAPGASSSSCFDVLMWHEEAHACVVTESSIANVILEIPGAHGQLYTPTCTALLPGLLLQELCARGAVTQREITVDALHEALRSGARLWLCNAVRGMFQVALV